MRGFLVSAMSLAAVFSLLPGFATAENQYQSDAECDVVIPSNQHLLDGETSGIDSGATICLAAGERGPLRIRNVLGSEEAPVVIRNEQGTVTTTPYEYSIAIEGSKWLRLTSIAPSESESYGIKLGGTLSIGALSEKIEIDHIEIYRARFAGMLIKTDPNCDSATWAENFTMSGIKIHHNYIHDTEEGEGMYVGYTGLQRNLECEGVATTVYPHKLQNVDISHNVLENIAADGIQLNSVLGDSRISQNRIYRTGVSPFSPYWQNTGIQVGGSDVEVSGNLIFKSGGNGMMLDGDALTVKDNHILYAGENGIFARNPAQQNAEISNGEPHQYKNNLIVQSTSYGIKLYAVNTVRPHQITDNSIENFGQVDQAGRPMTFSYLNSDVLVDENNNRHYIVSEKAQ
ncbi:right-handed parallel beta-helix repeat-containing protein [Planctobacterium marinum]|uniref:Right handed beta helix domain-containing protein n=1 Tax=Planctobacterium marinum TaxID=1631968 RepID=A0AA48HSE6_9ALTE|nr:hypothetical protein MACH26_33780 [Planctobacterium marinum]